jgi:hypothetical protein
MDTSERERTLGLTRDNYYEAIYALQAGLPPNPGDPDYTISRDNAAMAKIASLVPANAEEVALAVQFVLAHAQAAAILREMNEDRRDPVKCRTQSAGMMRQALSTRSLLLRVQAARQKREKSNAETDAAAWVEHIALDHMGQALERAPNGDPKCEPEYRRAAEPRDASMIDEVWQSIDPLKAWPPARPARTEAAAEEVPAWVVSASEALDRMKGIETPVRQAGAASCADDSPADVPAAPPVHVRETISQIHGNETPVRRAGSAPSTSAPSAVDPRAVLPGPRPASGPADHIDKRAVEPAKGAEGAASPGSAPFPPDRATIGQQARDRRHSDAEGLIRPASG